MAAAAPNAAALLQAARETLAATCDALTTRQSTITIFDESKGAPDYKRWREQLVSYVTSSRADFSAALT